MSVHLRPILFMLALATDTAAAQGGGVIGPPMNFLPAAKVDGLPPAQDLDASSSTTCAVSNGDVWCWGRCDFGHCDGTKGPEAEPVPQKVPGLSKVTQVSVAPISACALHTDGGVSCWGRTTGLVDQREAPRAPKRIRGMPRSTQISHGPGTVCALGVDRKVRCWGNNYGGQLGQGARLGPYKAPPPPRVIDKPGAPRAVRPLTARPLSGYEPPIVRVGIEESLKPLVVRGVSDAIAIAVGDSHACAVVDGGKVVCWGEAYLEEKTEEPEEEELTDVITARPTWRPDRKTTKKILRDGALHEIQLPSAATAVSANSGQSCALLDDGRVECWSYRTMSTPIDGPNACHDAATVTSLDDHAWYAVGANGDVLRAYGYCDRKAVQGVPAAVENSHTCARTSAGEVWCWGTNEHAQLGRPAQPFYKKYR
jgi:alpha-tubulin suppressor-like RCC1 family protein